MGWIRLATALLTVVTVGRALDLEAAAAVPGAYIVEYEDDNTDTNEFVGSLEGAKLRTELRSKVFNGASIQFTDVKKAEKVMTSLKVARRPLVKNVWPVKTFSLPGDTVHAVGPSVGALATSSALAKRQAPVAGEGFAPHVMTQVDKMRAAGFRGKGIKIAIIDTGVDWGHPALGGCFGKGCLVGYGEDLVGDNYTGSNTPVPDPDPMDNCNGHGTHVAGIIAAQANNSYGILGAAPDVTLGAFRVFGCDGQVGNDVLIRAYLAAFKAGSDIITASLGSAVGWSSEPWAVVVSRLVDEGVVCTSSAGNDGSVGQFYASSSSNGKSVTSIGSTDNVVIPSLVSQSSYTVNGTGTGFFNFTASANTLNWPTVNLPLWAVNYDITDPSNGCAPLPSTTPNLSGYIVLIRRGNCTFVEKAQYAVDKGAKYVLFYNNVPGASISPSAAVRGALGIAMVPAAQGETWIKSLQAGASVVVNLPNPDDADKVPWNSPNEQSAGTMSNYSSWGPTFEMDLKPQFSAPGGFILSTYPRELGSYAVLSGTSMSCPLSAAIYALVMNARGTKDPKTLQNVLSATAEPVKWRVGTAFSNDSFLAPVSQQGGGNLQAWDAAQAKTLLGTSSLSFNDTDYFVPERDFVITNTNDFDVTYRLGHKPAAAAYTFNRNNNTIADGLPMDLAAEYATLAFSKTGNFTVRAGGREIINVTAKPPTGLDAKRLPIYSGFITVDGSDGATLSLPYIGAVGSLHNTTVLVDGNAWLSRADDTSRPGRPVANNFTFLLPPPGQLNNTIYRSRQILPRFWITLNFGSLLIRGDVVPLSNCSTAALNATTVLGLKTVGQPEDFPSMHNRRGIQNAIDWSGLMSDGSYIDPGRYKVVFRALRVNGNPDLESEYEVAESQDFRIQYLTASTAPRSLKKRDC